jgi:hypothetical protein
MVANLSCPLCSQPMPVNLLVTGQPMQCPACHSRVEAYIFPEFHQDLSSSRPSLHLALEHEAVCYFHPRYRPITPCDHCGRFLCEICAISLGAKHLCGECFAKLRKQRDETGLVHYAALYDNVALFLVVAPSITVILWVFTLLTAPISLFLSFYYSSRQWNLVRRSRLRFGISILLSLVLIAFWTFIIYRVVTKPK